MEIVIDNHMVDVPCRCGQNIRESLGRLRDNPRLMCPKCLAVITVNDKQIRKITDKLQKGISSPSQ